MMDLRAQQYFRDEESYHKAMKLLADYLDAQGKSSNLDEISLEFLDQLDDTTGDDSKLLNQAIRYFRSRKVDGGIDPHAISVGQVLQRPSEDIGKPLDDAFEDFLSQKKSGWKKTGGMEEGYRVYFEVFKELVGNINTSELTKQHINDYIKAVQTIPSNRKKHARYRNLTVTDLLKLDIPEKDRLSAITKKRYLSEMKAFFQWLYTNDYSTIELHLPISNVKIKTKRSVDQRQSYTKEDIRKIFNSEEYIKGTHKRSCDYWVPLIALYTGARVNEICQLSVCDIRIDKETKRWVIDINEDLNDDPNKSLKRPYHARLVPVHQKLIELGFVEYVKHRRKRKDMKLFPELPYRSGVNKYADKFQRWFNRTYTNRVGTSDGTSFHSLRHTVISHLVNDKQVDANRIAVGLGQTPTGGVTQTTYTKTLSFRDYAQYFDLIDFDGWYDGSMIMDWKKNRFSRR